MADNISGGTAMARVTISRQLKGAPGKDATIYTIDLIPDSWTIGTNGLASIAEHPIVRVWKTTGEKREDITSTLTGSGALVSTLGMTIKGDGASITKLLTEKDGVYRINPNGANGAYKSLSIEVFENGLIGEASILASKSAAIASNGLPGAVRAPLRFLDWSTLGQGVRLYSGDGPNDLYTDIVYLHDAAKGTVEWGLCIQSFLITPLYVDSITGNLIHFSKCMKDGSPCFRAASQYSFLATDLFLAQEAVIRNLIAEKVIAGMPDGQRVEIRPEKKSMIIYDADGAERVRFSGEKKTIDTVRLSDISWTNQKTPAKLSSISEDRSDSGYLATANIPSGESKTTQVQMTLSATVEGAVMIPPATEQDPVVYMQGHAKVVVELKTAKGDVLDTAEIEVASDLPSAIDSGTKGKTKTESKRVTLQGTVEGGMATYITYRREIWYSNRDASKLISASASIEEINFGSFGSAISHTEYFANGWIIQQATNVFALSMWDPTKGMIHEVQNANGTGFRVSASGVEVMKNSQWITINI